MKYRRNICLLLIFFVSVCAFSCNKKDSGDGTQTNNPPARSFELPKRYKDTIEGSWTFQHYYFHYPSSSDPNSPYTIWTYWPDTTIQIQFTTDSTMRFGLIDLSYSDSLHGCYLPISAFPIDTAKFVHYWKKGNYACNYAVTYELNFNRTNDSLYLELDWTQGALGRKAFEIYRGLKK
jgi:hypothetical protein